MLTAVQRRLLQLCTALAALTLCGGAAAQASFEEEEIGRLVDGLRHGTVPVDLASAECQIGFEDSDEVEEMREFMSTFLTVPEDVGLKAFCDALVKAIKDGELSKAGLILVSRGGEDSSTAFEAGQVLRSIYFVHDRATLIAVPEAWR